MFKLLLIGFIAVLVSVPLMAADVSGNWDFTVDTSQGSGNPSFVFVQKGEQLTGTYTGLLGTADLTGTVKGDRIDFKFSFSYSGQSGVCHYTGTIQSATEMKGKVEFGELGDGEWTATKLK